MTTIPIEVVYAKPDLQTVLGLEITKGSTILTAIKQSKILELFPELKLDILKVGIFSEIKPLNTTLEAGDRIEIYRPLLIDPKQARIDRVKAQKCKKKKK
jgi:uncharacterized protein